MSLASLSLEDMYQYFESSIKHKAQLAIGSEHEIFCFDSQYRMIPYSLSLSNKKTHSESVSIEQLFLFFTKQKKYLPVFTDNIPLAITCDRTAITLEPGCQLELSGAPYQSLHDMNDEIIEYYRHLLLAEQRFDIHFSALGMNPVYAVEEIPHLPKKRYTYMKAYFPHKGQHGQDMMFRTATIQSNLDFTSEKDMAKKMKIATLLSPFINALFANSVYLDKHDTGYQYYRSHIWQNTDVDRCGFLRFIFQDSFGFEDYIQWLIDIPMIFLKIDGHYYDTGSMTFRDFMEHGFNGYFPTIEHFEQQVSLAFPEVRLKTYLELRGADSGPPSHIIALSAIWKGILYHEPNLEKALQLVEHLNFDDLEEIKKQISFYALNATHKKIDIFNTIVNILELSKSGLEHFSLKNQNQHDETIFLKPLFQIIEQKQTLADKTRIFMKNKNPLFDSFQLFDYAKVSKHHIDDISQHI